MNYLRDDEEVDALHLQYLQKSGDQSRRRLCLADLLALTGYSKEADYQLLRYGTRLRYRRKAQQPEVERRMTVQ